MDDSQTPVDVPPTIDEELPSHTGADFLDMALMAENVAEELLLSELLTIGRRVVEEYDIDKDSRAAWERRMKEALSLARQLRETKTWGGDVRANIKYPLISTACIQFSSRAYGNIVKGEDYVKVKVFGEDANGEKKKRAERVRIHMNAQLSAATTAWEDEMDQLLISMPLLGVAFKKTYRNFIDSTTVSEYVDPERLVVHYWAKSMETASRVTHVIEMTKNQYLEHTRSGLWRDAGIEHKQPDVSEEELKKKQGDVRDTESTYIFLEQHRWLDLDRDGYKEPYIVTVHKASNEVMRIVPRFRATSVIRNPNGEVIKIIPDQYFTRYLFFPDFDANFYGLGFGILLSPVNETVNSLINQLLDSGTLQNRQSGFINRGIRLMKAGGSGSIKFKAGEWKFVKSAGDDLRKSIFPLPTKEPSATLFSLLGLMLEAAQTLASQAEVLSGEQTQPNVPATTTLALIEQGLKVFSSIYKRIHRALKSEFLKIQRLNMLFTTPEEYNRILDMYDEGKFDPRVDYDMDDMDIGPVSSTADVSDTQKIIKAEALMQISGRGLDDQKILARYLDAIQIDNWEELVPESPQPNIQLIMFQKNLEIEHAKIQQSERELNIKEREVMIKDAETFYKMVKLQADSVKAIALAEAAELGPQIAEYKTQVTHLTAVINAKRVDLEADLKQRQYEDQQRREAQGGAQPGGGTGQAPGAKAAPGMGGGQGAAVQPGGVV